MGRSYMLLISSPSMSLVVALLMMFVSDVLSQTELAPAPAPITCVNEYIGASDAEGNQLMPLLAKLQGWQVAM
jgi:ABC-type Fe3+-siderophore transport system permease subunit